MINLPELPINEEARNDAHIAIAGVLAHTGGCRMKKRNGKLVMYQKVS